MSGISTSSINRLIYITLLKGAQAGERRTPLHPALLTTKFLEYLQQKNEGYVIDLSTDIGSLHNTAIDLWREAGLNGEVRKALVAHANTDVQDRVYGEGLKNMPDVLFKELS